MAGGLQGLGRPWSSHTRIGTGAIPRSCSRGGRPSGTRWRQPTGGCGPWPGPPPAHRPGGWCCQPIPTAEPLDSCRGWWADKDHQGPALGARRQDVQACSEGAGQASAHLRRKTGMNCLSGGSEWFLWGPWGCMQGCWICWNWSELGPQLQAGLRAWGQISGSPWESPEAHTAPCPPVARPV